MFRKVGQALTRFTGKRFAQFSTITPPISHNYLLHHATVDASSLTFDLPPPLIAQRRYYGSKNKVGKSGAKSGAKGSKSGLSFDLNDVDFSPLFSVQSYETDFQSELDNAKMEFQLQYVLRTDLKAYEETSVRLSDQQNVPLNHVATVSLKDRQTVIVSVSSLDKVKPVKDALEKSMLNLNPQVSGLTLIVPLPKVTREHRETLAKNTKNTFAKFSDRFHKIKTRYQKGWDIKESQGKASPEVVKQAFEMTKFNFGGAKCFNNGLTCNGGRNPGKNNPP